ncbi:hypothetical protein B0H34DRAFT_677656 [Crassisporium funariophilum]|nr:hypothetical protein B0H34DRAFT_677656 [Crassisporium funariophilum]
MSDLLSLAPELIHEISNKLDIGDVKNLRLACRHLGQLLATQVLRVIYINHKKDQIDKDLEKLRALATKAGVTSTGTQELIIRSLTPGRDPEWKGFTYQQVNGEYVPNPEPEDPPEVALAEENMKMYLYDSLCSLKNLRTVRWVSACT